jgi:hypothetical protein
MTIYNIIKELSQTSKRTEKEAILNSNVDNFLLKEVFRLAYDPYIRFWIKKIPEHTYRENTFLSLDIVLFSELPRLFNRQVTGNEAINLLSHLLSATHKDDSDLIKLIIKKDLNCGVSESTINKIWPNLISTFKVMKCHNTIEHIKYPAIIQTKCDGMRCIIERHPDGESYTAYSSSGRQIEFGDHFNESVKVYMLPSERFDGELICIDETGKHLDRKTSNGIINSLLKKPETFPEDKLKLINFVVWDIEDHTDNVPYNNRFFNLKERFTSNQRNFKLIDWKIVCYESEAIEYFQNQLSMGNEGAILKNLDGTWQGKRVKHQGKLKDELEAELKVVGIIPHSKFPELIGALIMETSDGVKFNVGSGLTDELRSTLDHNSVIDRIYTVRFNDVITNKNDDSYNLFLPRLIEERLDKSTPDSMEIILSLKTNEKI